MKISLSPDHFMKLIVRFPETRNLNGPRHSCIYNILLLLTTLDFCYMCNGYTITSISK